MINKCKKLLFAISAFSIVATGSANAQIDPFDLSQAGVQIKDTGGFPATLGGQFTAPLVTDINVLISASAVDISSLSTIGAWTAVDPAQIYLDGSAGAKAYYVVDRSPASSNTHDQWGYQFTPGSPGVAVDDVLVENTAHILFEDLHRPSAPNPPADSPLPTTAAIDAVSLGVSDKIAPGGSYAAGKVDMFVIKDPNATSGLYDVFWTDGAVGPGQVFANSEVAFYNADFPTFRSWLHTDGEMIMYTYDDTRGSGVADFYDQFVLFESSALIIVPEPSTYFLLGSVLFLVMVKRRKPVACVVKT
jgi:hypothetical protein